MRFVYWLVVGGLIGWVASRAVGTRDRGSVLANVAVGIAGAFLGGSLLDILLGSWAVAPGGRSLARSIVPLLGAGIVLAFLRLARNAAAR